MPSCTAANGVSILSDRWQACMAHPRGTDDVPSPFYVRFVNKANEGPKHAFSDTQYASAFSMES